MNFSSNCVKLFIFKVNPAIWPAHANNKWGELIKNYLPVVEDKNILRKSWNLLREGIRPHASWYYFLRDLNILSSFIALLIFGLLLKREKF